MTRSYRHRELGQLFDERGEGREEKRTNVKNDLVEALSGRPDELNPRSSRRPVRRPLLRGDTTSVRLKTADDTVDGAGGREGPLRVAVERRNLDGGLAGDVGRGDGSGVVGDAEMKAEGQDDGGEEERGRRTYEAFAEVVVVVLQ